jgi:hypothetical protein
MPPDRAARLDAAAAASDRTTSALVRRALRLILDETESPMGKSCPPAGAGWDVSIASSQPSPAGRNLSPTPQGVRESGPAGLHAAALERAAVLAHTRAAEQQQHRDRVAEQNAAYFRDLEGNT